jgi:hypothetical protein
VFSPADGENESNHHMKTPPVLLAAALAFAFLASPSPAKDFKYSEKNLKGAYTFRLVPATSFSPFSTTSGFDTAPRQDFLRVGVFVADGKGKVKGRIVATTDDNAGTTVVKNFRFTGTYTVGVDGFGTLSIEPVATVEQGEDVTDEGAETYAIKLNDRSKLVHMIQTDNAGGGAKIFLTGDALIERPIGEGDLD